MSLSMRVPSVSPREADAVGSLSRGNAVGETREEGGKLQFSYIEECQMERGDVAF